MAAQILILLAIGAALGLILRGRPGHRLLSTEIAGGAGAMGSFLAGGLFLVISGRSVSGWIDPLATAVGAAGAIAFLVLLDYLPHDAGHRADTASRSG